MVEIRPNSKWRFRPYRIIPTQLSFYSRYRFLKQEYLHSTLFHLDTFLLVIFLFYYFIWFAQNNGKIVLVLINNILFFLFLLSLSLLFPFSEKKERERERVEKEKRKL